MNMINYILVYNQIVKHGKIKISAPVIPGDRMERVDGWNGCFYPATWPVDTALPPLVRM